ncbi:MAG: TetR/AcrR family transcriptional regulator [Mariniphaga sp.]
MAPTEITSEQILADSGVSKGSLYHHFVDFPDLIEQAQVFLFSAYVGESIEAINSLITQTSSRQEVLGGLKAIARAPQMPSPEKVRSILIESIAKSIRSDRMRELMAVEQEKLVEAISDLFREAQERGWANPKLNPRVVAVFIIANSLGQIVADLSSEHIDRESWYRLFDRVLENVLFKVDETVGESL